MVDNFWVNSTPTKVYILDRNLKVNSPVKKTLTPIKKTLTPINKVIPVENSYKDVKIPFGKFRGKLLADIPNSYLTWLLEQEFFELRFKDIWKMTKLEKEYRKKFNICIR
jgi:uncharacterized protein (DUF3820 family)